MYEYSSDDEEYSGESGSESDYTCDSSEEEGDFSRGDTPPPANRTGGLVATGQNVHLQRCMGNPVTASKQEAASKAPAFVPPTGAQAAAMRQHQRMRVAQDYLDTKPANGRDVAPLALDDARDRNLYDGMNIVPQNFEYQEPLGGMRREVIARPHDGTGLASSAPAPLAGTWQTRKHGPGDMFQHRQGAGKTASLLPGQSFLSAQRLGHRLDDVHQQPGGGGPNAAIQRQGVPHGWQRLEGADAQAAPAPMGATASTTASRLTSQAHKVSGAPDVAQNSAVSMGAATAAAATPLQVAGRAGESRRTDVLAQGADTFRSTAADLKVAAPGVVAADASGQRRSTEHRFQAPRTGGPTEQGQSGAGREAGLATQRRQVEAALPIPSTGGGQSGRGPTVHPLLPGTSFRNNLATQGTAWEIKRDITAAVDALPLQGASNAQLTHRELAQAGHQRESSAVNMQGPGASAVGMRGTRSQHSAAPELGQGQHAHSGATQQLTGLSRNPARTDAMLDTVRHGMGQGGDDASVPAPRAAARGPRGVRGDTRLPDESFAPTPPSVHGGRPQGAGHAIHRRQDATALHSVAAAASNSTAHGPAVAPTACGTHRSPLDGAWGFGARLDGGARTPLQSTVHQGSTETSKSGRETPVLQRFTADVPLAFVQRPVTMRS